MQVDTGDALILTPVMGFGTDGRVKFSTCTFKVCADTNNSCICMNMTILLNMCLCCSETCDSNGMFKKENHSEEANNRTSMGEKKVIL